MVALILAFLVSVVVTLLLIRYQNLHKHITGDHDLVGVQKFHSVVVPRVGGLSVFLGSLFGLLAKWFLDRDVSEPNLILLACALPVFLAGFVEDLTKKVGVRERLLGAIVSAALGGYFLGGGVTHLDLPIIDAFLSVPHVSLGEEGGLKVLGALSFLITCFAVAGVSNAFNLIDGYNGLAGVVAVIILLGLSYVADILGDRVIMVGALTMVGAIVGFLIWNYPNGLIFLGDAGAYLIGFVVAELSVLLVARNPAVSPWFPLLLSFYPIFETLFTIFRRRVVSKKSPGMPDAAHLHQLIYRRLVRWAVGSSMVHDQTLRNALTAPYLWVLSSLAVIPAILFWQNTYLLAAFTLIFAAIYSYIYWRIIRRKFPSWWTIKRKARH